MSLVSVDKDKILEELKKTQYQEISEAFKKLKKEWDWNPFNDDSDEYKTAWEEFRHNIELLTELLTKIVISIEKIAKTLLGIVSGGAKLEAAAQFLDDIIKLPFYIEWFDKHFFKFMIGIIVTKLNEKYTHDWQNAGILDD